jgi:hypothetical protein
MNINRVQGLLDLYHKAGKSRDVVLVQAEYLKLQGLLTDAEYQTVINGLDAVKDAPIDIVALVEETAALRAEMAALETENAMLKRGGIVSGKT